MGSYSRTGYMAIKRESSENVAVKPDVFVPFLSEDITVEYGETFSQSVTNNRSLYFRPVSHAIPAPEGTITIEVEPNTIGHFLRAAGGSITTGRYIPITSASGDFTVGETITGGTSSETATIIAMSTEGDYILTSDFSGAFTDGETITGGSSSTTATLTRADSLAYGHVISAPQTTIDDTYTLEFGYDNEAHRFTGVRFPEIVWNQTDNVIRAQIKVMARGAYRAGRVTAVTTSGSGSKTITVDQTTGLIATDTVKVFRPSTGAFLDFSASGVKTHTVGALTNETSFTVTDLQTSLAVGDLIVLAPQTTSYSVKKEFIWAGGSTMRLASTITTALTATPDNIEDFEVSLVNNMESRHAAVGSNFINRFPAKMFTAGLDGTGSINRTYTDVAYMQKLRGVEQTAIHWQAVGSVMTTVSDFNYIFDVRIPDARLNNFAPNIAEDDLINQDMPFQMFNSTTDGYFFKALLVNEQTSY